MEGRPMVSYSTGVMNSLVDRLNKLEVHHPKLKDLREDLENLKKDLLDEFAGRGAKDKQVKVWIKQVRELVYDIDDWIELEPLTNLGESEIKQIEEFKAQIQEARESCTRYDLPKKVPTSDADLSDVGRSKVPIDSRLLWEEKTVLVTVDVAKNELEKHLMNEKKKLKVVCVVGMEGYGKTSIAKEIYGKLGRQFDCQAFVSVGRRPSMKRTLMDILRQVNPQDEREYCDVRPVIAELWKFLGTKRYFILIDDLRSTWAWKVIKSALPDKNLGSRVLTTTCIMDVAKSCSIHPSDVMYRVETLSEKNSRSLFRSRISIGEEEERPAGFNEVSDDMLKMCGGVPLAIIVTAGLLTRKSAELGPSKRLEKYTLSASDQYSTSQGMRNILDISFADLSLPVKSCFLYVSVFPENYTIKKDRLIRVWVAEGFIPKRDEETSWETGESYFNELVSRRLIQPVFDYDDGQAVGCTVHGVILDFIASLSSEENFVTAGAELRSGPFPCDTIRRFSLDCSNQEEEDDTLASSTVHISKVRSLACFGDVKRMPDETLHSLTFLRVLDLQDTENLKNRHLKGIGRLVLLRYLGLGGTGIDELPEEIEELQRLETLDLRRATLLRTLPASIVRLRRLVSLLGECVQLPSGIGNMQDLEELSTIDAALSLDSVAELLIKSKRLRMLGVRCNWDVYYYTLDRETTETYRRSVMSFLKEAEKSNLQSLFLECDREDGLLDILLDSWVPPHHLRRFELTISGPLTGVPPKMASVVNLTHLRISIYEAEAEGLRVLGDLPNLILLKLESRVFHAKRRLITSRHGFRCLVVFSYKCLFDGMGLQFTPGAMPQLRRLRIEFSAMETEYLHGDFDFGIQHLSCLTRVHAAIHCQDARKSLEEVEAAITEQVSKNPNSSVLELSREIIVYGGMARQEEHETVQESYEQESRISDKDSDEEHATLQKQHEIIELDVDSNTNKQADSRVSTLLSESSSHLVNPASTAVAQHLASFHSPTHGNIVYQKGFAVEAAAVSASQGAMGSLLEKLGDLLADKYKLLKEAKGKIRFLRAELLMLHASLLDMSDVEEPDEQAKCWVKEVRELSYDIEDGVDELILRVERESNSKPHRFKGFIERSINLLTTINTRHKIAKELQGLKGRVMEVSERRTRYKVDDAVSKPNNTTIDPRLLALYAETAGLVGIEGPREELIQLMMDEEGVSAQQLKVLSIVGFGGLGKTTLAKEIYHKLASQFQCRAFVSVSQKPNVRKIFRNILSQVGYAANMEVCDEDELISTLQKFLTDKRYIIVIDDVWDAIAWNIIRCALPENKNGSRVITTTRIETVATTCCSNHYGYVYKMRPLSSEYSRMLFLNRVFGSEDACPPNLGEVSAEILKRCGGLPLAIITISSLLASQRMEELKESWEHIQNSLSSNFEVNPTLEGMRQILSLSYISLPQCLKTCMLYLGVYPEDYEIDKYDLVRQWAAQGFISKELGRDPEDVAEGYFNELVNRSIIQPVVTDLNDDVLSCRVHDMMLDLIIHKCREENFITAIDDIQDITGLHDKVRRLSLCLDGVIDGTTLGTVRLSQVRALARFGTSTYAPRLLEFKHLRVLRLEFPSRNRESVILDLTRMCHLFQLRYLKVVALDKITLPSKIRGLQQLETLDLRGSRMVEVPSDVVHLRRLLHLIVPYGKGLPGGIGDMKSLRTLRDFDLDINSIDNIRDLGDLTNLRDLNICFFRGEEQLDDMAARRRGVLRSSLEKLSNLKYLTIGHTFHGAYWDELSSPFASFSLLERLHMWCTFSRVPKRIDGLHNLYDLMLRVKEVQEDDVGILAQLPSLICLDLNIVGTPREKVVIRGMGFRVLKHFRICSRISYLTFEAGAMPNLQRLHLYFNARGWHKYGAAPVGIEHLSGLKDIFVVIGGRGAKESNRRAAQSALRDAIDVHPSRPTANIECEDDWRMFFVRVENEEEEEDENVNNNS